MKKREILVVEDDSHILDAIGYVLGDEGYSVIKAEKGNFIEKLFTDGEKLPDLIILDLRLADGDGRDICKKLKSHKTLKKIPVIMISAFPNVKDSSLAAGADDFLAKPFEVEELLKKVYNFLG